MKALILTLMLFCNAITAYSKSDTRTIEDILNLKETKSSVYTYRAGLLEAVVINMTYGQEAIISVMDKSNLRKAQIIQVDLVYTDFPNGIDLKELNRRRINKALEVNSTLINNESIQWRLVRQMKCRSEAEAKTYFHGIVIYYIPETNGAYYLSELSNYDSLPQKYEELKPGETQKGRNIKIEKKFKMLADSTVIAVFRRHKKWNNNATVVADVTCSMSPYVCQMALWFLYKISLNGKTNIVFFNDGDGIADKKKINGATGGIYCMETNNYDSFYGLLRQSTSKGCSGDIAENVVEAILNAQNEFPNSKEIILIADNYAGMRDYKLLDQIKVPVHVVLCGTQFGLFNYSYLWLAYKTKGSIHTMHEDLQFLKGMAEGTQIKFGGESYVIQSDRIDLLRRAQQYVNK